MPRRPVLNKIGTDRKQRTRTGCQQCRLRKIKCDEQKPKCGQCSAKGHHCQTFSPLKWEQDYRSRGLAFGRTGIWSKNNPPARRIRSLGLASPQVTTHWCHVPLIWPYSFVNATVESSKTDDRVALTTARSHWSSPSIPLIRAPDFLPGLRDPLGSVLLSYYLERLCPLTVSSFVATSPFASLLFPSSVFASSPAVLSSVLALSACHRAKQQPTYKDLALRLAGSVLRHLHQKLRTEDPAQVALDSDTLVIMVMLCLFEIVNESDERWVVHLRGARDLIRVRRQAVSRHKQYPTDSNHDELAIFAEKFFAYHDVLGRTACGEEPVFGGDFWASSHGTSSDIADPWLGCSPELISILCEITVLSRRRAGDAVAVVHTTAFHVATASLEARLGTLRQRVIVYPGDNILQTSAELKRLTAAFYLDCALRSAHPFLPESRVAIRQILRLVFSLLRHHAMAGLAWPIFVAAVELNPLEDLALWTAEEEEEAGFNKKSESAAAPCHGRPFVLYALDQMAWSSVSNVSQTRAIIEKVWQSRDMEAVKELPNGNECPPLPRQSDWERHVAPFCHGLSLG